MRSASSVVAVVCHDHEHVPGRERHANPPDELVGHTKLLGIARHVLTMPHKVGLLHIGADEARTRSLYEVKGALDDLGHGERDGRQDAKEARVGRDLPGNGEKAKEDRHLQEDGQAATERVELHVGVDLAHLLGLTLRIARAIAW